MLLEHCRVIFIARAQLPDDWPRLRTPEHGPAGPVMQLSLRRDHHFAISSLLSGGQLGLNLKLNLPKLRLQRLCALLQ